MKIKETDSFSKKCYKTGASLAALAIILPFVGIGLILMIVIIMAVLGV